MRRFTVKGTVILQLNKPPTKNHSYLTVKYLIFTAKCIVLTVKCRLFHS